jgi:uncharacterized protein YjdB
MKTKNIFRMLLVAVTLLLGANNVKAETIWSTPFSGKTTIPAEAFNNAKNGTIIRVHVTDVNQWSWQIGFSFSNNANPDFSDFDGITTWGSTWAYQNSGLIGGNHFDLTCSLNTLKGLAECGLTIEPVNMTVSSISLEEGGSVVKVDPTLSFSESSFTAYLGQDNSFPTLNNQDNLPVTWSSSDPSVATIDDNGAITLIGEGDTDITASFAGNDDYNEGSVSYTLTVSKTTPTLTFENNQQHWTIGTAFTLPTLTISPEGLTPTWSSSETSVATIDASTGEITLVGAGNTTITATIESTNEYNEASASYSLTVYKGNTTLSFTETELEVNLGDDFTPPTLNNPDEVSITYSSTNTNVATVDESDGTVTIIGSGETQIKAIHTEDNRFYYAEASYKLTVKGTDSKENVSLSFNPTVVYATQGDASITKPTLTSSVDGLTFSYGSSNTNIATVDNNTGDVTLNGQPGVVTISAQFNGNDYYNDARAEYTLVVKTAFAGTTEGETVWTGSTYFGNWHNGYGEWAEIPTNALSSINVGDEIRFYGTLETLSDVYWQLQVNYDNNGAWTEVTTQQGYGFNDRYTSLKVTEDNINNLKNKMLYIQGYNLTLYYITVVPKSTKASLNMSYTPSRVDLNLGESFTAPSLSIKDADGNDVIGLTITYTSSNEDLAIVAADGTITLNNVTGTATITASFAGDDTYEAASAHFTITVTNPEEPSYSITVNSATNGTVTADSESATEGATVTLTITPASGYEVNEISVKDENNADVEVNMTNYTFTMPASDVTVTVTFKETSTTPTEKTSFTFEFSEQSKTVTFGDDFVEPTLTTNIIVPTEVWNNVTYYSSNTNVAEVDNNGNVTIKGVGTTDITVSFSGDDNYYPASASYTLVVLPNTRTASIGSSGYATFSCDVALDFTGITSLKAYIAKSIDANWVVLEQVIGTVAANTGLVIVGTTTNIPVSDSGSSYSNNLLVPGENESVSGSGIYVLTNESGTVKFAAAYNSAHSAYVPVGKAYLVAPSASGARLNIRWGDDATGIQTLKSEFSNDDAIYDLQGQRVVTPTKGLYIINGKKVVIK